MTDRPTLTGAATPSARVVNCPACRQASLFSPENPWRPFCSPRCQGHDFGAWANEAYRVGTLPPAPEDPDQ